MGDLAIAALFIALAVVIVLIGPARLAEMAKALGGALRGAPREAGEDRDRARGV
jgi:Sec-independent protein translocase protein TatA